MKTIIFAGGFGTRLGNITETVPKPMIKIGGKPILWHIMKIYASFGYKDFIVALGYKFEVIKDFFYNYDILNNDFTIELGSKKTKILRRDETDWNITLIYTGLNTLKGARLKRLEPYLDSDLNMVTYGDGVSDININDLISFHKSHNKILTITGVHPPSRFGEIIVENGKLVSFKEKPQTSVGLINGGFMVFNKKLLDYLTEDETSDLESGTFETLISQEQIMVYKHTGKWECIDTERDLRHLNKLWNNNEAFWKVWKD